MNVQLEVSHSQANVRRVVLRSDTVIGRAPECNLRIASNEVSRRHCKLILTGDAVLVRDLGSANGTFVDGVQLEPELDVAVAPGSQLSVGGVKFIVHFDRPVLGDSDLEPDATGSTIDYPHGIAAAAAPEAAAADTVHNNPGETIRDDRHVSPPSTECATEWRGGEPSATVDLDEDLTTLEPLPDGTAAAPAGTSGAPVPTRTPSDDLHDFLRQFGP